MLPRNALDGPAQGSDGGNGSRFVRFCTRGVARDVQCHDARKPPLGPASRHTRPLCLEQACPYVPACATARADLRSGERTRRQDDEAALALRIEVEATSGIEPE